MTSSSGSGRGERAKGDRRPFISIYFRCCHVYQRLYRHPDGNRYEGCCPRCLRKLTVPIGEGGTEQRSFEAL